MCVGVCKCVVYECMLGLNVFMCWVCVRERDGERTSLV